MKQGWGDCLLTVAMLYSSQQNPDITVSQTDSESCDLGFAS